MVMPRTIATAILSAGGAENEEGRRPTLVSAPPAASPELVDRPRRRRAFTAVEKVRILAEIDCAGPGGTGAILRREGLYSSALTDWRRQRDAGAYEALKAVKRGPKRALTGEANSGLIRMPAGHWRAALDARGVRSPQGNASRGQQHDRRIARRTDEKVAGEPEARPSRELRAGLHLARRSAAARS